MQDHWAFFKNPINISFLNNKTLKKRLQKKCFAFNFRNWVFLKYPDIYYKRIFVKEPQWTYKYIWYTHLGFYQRTYTYTCYAMICPGAYSHLNKHPNPHTPLPPSKPSDYGFCNPKPGRFFKRSPKNQITGLRKFFHFIFLKPLLLLLLNYQIPAPTLGSLTLHYK